MSTKPMLVIILAFIASLFLTAGTKASNIPLTGTASNIGVFENRTLLDIQFQNILDSISTGCFISSQLLTSSAPPSLPTDLKRKRSSESCLMQRGAPPSSPLSLEPVEQTSTSTPTAVCNALKLLSLNKFKLALQFGAHWSNSGEVLGDKHKKRPGDEVNKIFSELSIEEIADTVCGVLTPEGWSLMKVLNKELVVNSAGKAKVSGELLDSVKTFNFEEQIMGVYVLNYKGTLYSGQSLAGPRYPKRSLLELLAPIYKISIETVDYLMTRTGGLRGIQGRIILDHLDLERRIHFPTNHYERTNIYLNNNQYPTIFSAASVPVTSTGYVNNHYRGVTSIIEMLFTFGSGSIGGADFKQYYTEKFRIPNNNNILISPPNYWSLDPSLNIETGLETNINVTPDMYLFGRARRTISFESNQLVIAGQKGNLLFDRHIRLPEEFQTEHYRNLLVGEVASVYVTFNTVVLQDWLENKYGLPAGSVRLYPVMIPDSEASTDAAAPGIVLILCPKGQPESTSPLIISLHEEDLPTSPFFQAHRLLEYKVKWKDINNYLFTFFFPVDMQRRIDEEERIKATAENRPIAEMIKVKDEAIRAIGVLEEGDQREAEFVEKNS